MAGGITPAALSEHLERLVVQFCPGQCHRLLAPVPRRSWVPQFRQDPQRFVLPPAFPKPCQASSEGWAAEFRGLEVLA